MNAVRLSQSKASDQTICCDAADFGLYSELISPGALNVIATLQAAGYQTYIVGGSIRDILLDNSPKDFDVATCATPHQIVRNFSRSRIVGKRFKIVHVRLQRELIEVTTFRSMLRPDATNNQVTRDGMIIADNEYGNLEEDMMRRDFTVNAIYYDPFNNQLIAHADALADIKHGRLRFIGDAWQRYREDPVRILRAIRLASKTGLKLDGKAVRAIAPLSPLLHEVSSARLFEEAIKLFHCGAALSACLLLQRYRLFSMLFPLAAKALENDTGGKQAALLKALFVSTDQRIADDKPVIPSFAIAIILWLSLSSLARSRNVSPHRKADLSLLEECRPPDKIQTGPELRSALCRILDFQNSYVFIPRRIAGISLEICLLQLRFENRRVRSMHYLFEHVRFRAAYDFFCLCAEAGLASRESALWWTKLQEMDEKSRQHAIKQRAEKNLRPHFARKRKER